MNNFFVGPILKLRIDRFLKQFKKWAKEVNLDDPDTFLSDYGAFLDAERDNKPDHIRKIAKVCLNMKNVKRYYTIYERRKDNAAI